MKYIFIMYLFDVFLDKKILKQYPSLYIKEIYPAFITNYEE